MLCKRIVLAMNASEKMLFSTQNITCEVAYIWLLSNRLRLNNDSAGSHIKEEGNISLICTQLVFVCSTEFVRSIYMSLLDLEG